MNHLTNQIRTNLRHNLAAVGSMLYQELHTENIRSEEFVNVWRESSPYHVPNTQTLKREIPLKIYDVEGHKTYNNLMTSSVVEQFDRADGPRNATNIIVDQSLSDIADLLAQLGAGQVIIMPIEYDM